MPLGKILGMAADESWRNLEGHERVRWARLYWQRKTNQPLTARAAALSLGMGENTYSAYERRPDASKSTALSADRADEFAHKFKVRWEWLLRGTGAPWLTEADQPDGPREQILRAVDDAASGDPAEFEQKAAAIVTLLRTPRPRQPLFQSMHEDDMRYDPKIDHLGASRDRSAEEAKAAGIERIHSQPKTTPRKAPARSDKADRSD